MAQITIEFDADRLASYSDTYLATLWHVAQANPAPYGDWAAADLVKRIGWEIIRRWLRGVDPEMYHHQAEANYHQWLTLFARYEPPPGHRSGLDRESVAAFHAGRWVARSPQEIQDEIDKRRTSGRYPAELFPEPVVDTEGGD